jgi:hypothetical protein
MGSPNTYSREAGWTPEPMLMLQNGEDLSPLLGIEPWFVSLPTCSLVIVLCAVLQFLIMVVYGMCEWYVASAYDMASRSAVTWSTLQCTVSHKDVQNIIHRLAVLNLEKKIKIPWCWVLGSGLLCFVIVICAGKYLIANTLMMSESELLLLEIFF